MTASAHVCDLRTSSLPLVLFDYQLSLMLMLLLGKFSVDFVA